MQATTLYLGTLERFGGTIECLSNDKVKAEKKIMKEYEEIYRRVNDGEDPRCSYDRIVTSSDYNWARECIEWHEYEIDKVEVNV